MTPRLEVKRLPVSLFVAYRCFTELIHYSYKEMSGVTFSLKAHNFTNLFKEVTQVPNSYENATFLDFVVSHEPNIVHDINGPGVNKLMKTPVWMIILMTSILTWVIFANGVIFLCLITSRDALKNNVNVQLLSLSITDMLVGINAIPATFLPMMNHLFSTYESCAIMIYMYLIAQAATLCHTLLICVNRLVTIKRKSSTNGSSNESLRIIFMQIMAIWIGCFLFYSIHFLVFARFGETVNRCSIFLLFADNYLVAVVLLTVPLLVPAQLCTNIIYVYLFIHIRQKLRVVDIVQATQKNPPDEVRLQSYRVQEEPSTSLKTQGDTRTRHHLMIQTESQVTKEHNCSVGYAQTKVRSINEQEADTSTSDKSKCNRNNDPDGEDIAPKTKSKGGDSTHCHDSRTNNNRLGLERQRRVLVTFGILLLTLNLFMTPLDVLGIIEVIRNRPIPNIPRFIFITMAMLNSAFNPVINIWRMKPFRMIMKEKAMKIYELLRFWRT